MDTIQLTTTYSLSDQPYDELRLETENIIFNEVHASANVHDDMIRPYDPTCACETQSKVSLSHYEPLDVLTLVDRSQTINHYEDLNNDVWNDIFPLPVKKIQKSLSPNQLDVSKEVDCRSPLYRYEELNNDVWNDIFPCNYKSTPKIQLQPSFHISQVKDTAKTNYLLSSECSETRQTLLDNDQSQNEDNCISSSLLSVRGTVPVGVMGSPPLHLNLVDKVKSLERAHYTALVVTNSYKNSSGDSETHLSYQLPDNECETKEFCYSRPSSRSLKIMMTSAVGVDYDYITEDDKSPTAVGVQCSGHSQTGRPLPGVPFDIYEALDLSKRNENNIQSLLTHRTCVFIGKCVSILTVVVVFVIIAVVTTRAVLINPNDKTPSKFFVDIFVSLFFNADTLRWE